MRIFGTIVQPFVAAMLDARHHLLLRSLIAAQLHPARVPGNQHAWNVRAALQSLPEELFRRSLVPSALHQDIEHITVLINGTPQIVLLTVDFQENFVE